MGICWHCYWGLPNPVADVFEAALREIDENDLRYGPGHIVFDDHNLSGEDIDFCIKECDHPSEYRESQDPADYVDHKKWLLRLKEIPESVRNSEPEDYDDENPADFPPPPDRPHRHVKWH
jgi:hypothetical protein